MTGAFLTDDRCTVYYADESLICKAHCLKFTEQNFMLGVHDLHEPYFHVSLSLKCFYQFSIHMN